MDDESRKVAAHLDFPARAQETPQPFLVVVGEQDELGYAGPAAELAGKLADGTLVWIPGMGHALAEEPGLEAAPQTAHAAKVDRVVSDWLL